MKLENVSVSDWGRGGKPITRYVAFGENVKYVSLDKNPAAESTLLVDMEEKVELAEKSDFAFCMEVLEHTKNPDRVLANIWWNLKQGGTLILSVPFLFEVHHDEDYWRFTDIGLRMLLERNGFTVEEMIATENRAGWIAKAKRL